MELIPPINRQSLDARRREIADIESRIKAIVGDNPNLYFDESQSREKAREIDGLLSRRKDCLNSLFRGTPMELERFSHLNNRLIDLNTELVKRIVAHHDALSSVVKDYEVEQFDVYGRIYPGVGYCPEEDIKELASLEDDDYYGSDFAYMCFVCHQNCCDNESAVPYIASHIYRFLDDEWPEDVDPESDPLMFHPLHDQPALCRVLNEPMIRLLGIKYPTYYALIFTNYSIPDLLRIETFDVGLSTICRECTQLYK